MVIKTTIRSGQKKTRATKSQGRRPDVMDYINDRVARDPAFAAGVSAAYDKLELARQLREARESRGLSQAQLAARLKTSQPSIARMERGRMVPRLALLDRVAHALGGTLHVALCVPTSGRRAAR